MHLRRSAAALALLALLGTGAAPVALSSPSSSPAGTTPDALYGDGDPRHDAVWRQSLVLLAQHAVDERPVPAAVDWLADQQCADGSFRSYRPDPTTGCGDAEDADVNATAAAVQALVATGGHRTEVARSVRWLRSVQNDDGGWGYHPGDPSDANSVAVVVGALTAAGVRPHTVRPTASSGDEQPSAYDALLAFQLGCDAPAGQRGAFAYQPEPSGRLTANDAATVAAVTAALGQGLAAEPAAEPAATPQPPRCTGDAHQPAARTPADAAEAGAAYLIRTLRSNDWHLRLSLPGGEETPDYGNTALAAVALAAGGHRDAARRSVAWLERHLDGWQGYRANPAALAHLVLATDAVGGTPRDFAGTDLVARLAALGPAPQRQTGSPDDNAQDHDEVEQAWWIVGAAVLAGVGVGALLSYRTGRRGA